MHLAARQPRASLPFVHYYLAALSFSTHGSNDAAETSGGRSARSWQLSLRLHHISESRLPSLYHHSRRSCSQTGLAAMPPCGLSRTSSRLLFIAWGRPEFVRSMTGTRREHRRLHSLLSPHRGSSHWCGLAAFLRALHHNAHTHATGPCSDCLRVLCVSHPFYRIHVTRATGTKA